MTSVPTAIRNGQGELTTLARTINKSHRACESAIRDGVRHAIDCGNSLIETKATLRHGGWLKWLATKCPDVSARTAQAYMQLAGKLPGLTSKAQQVAHLTVREALKLVAERQDDQPAILANTRARIKAAETMAPSPEAVRELKMVAENVRGWQNVMGEWRRCAERVSDRIVANLNHDGGDLELFVEPSKQRESAEIGLHQAVKELHDAVVESWRQWPADQLDELPIKLEEMAGILRNLSRDDFFAENDQIRAPPGKARKRQRKWSRS